MTTEAEADIRRKEAAEWFARLNQRKVTTADVHAFSEWRRDAENARAFSRMEAMWEAAGTLAGSPEIATVTREAADRRTPSRGSGSLSGRRLVPIGLAGMILLALGGAGWLWYGQRPVTFTTAVGEQRTVRLEDGSRITLDTATRVSVRYSGSQRTVTLSNGQAMFDVASEAARPFLVRAGDTEVRALGTQFDVRRSGAGARVLLVEGQVVVRQSERPETGWSLAPGQQVTTSTPRPEVVEVNVPAATSWTTGRLTFENTPISEAVAEVNRYTPDPIELRDDSIASIPVSGVFNAGDVDGFVAALTDLYRLQATRSPDGGLILTGPG